MGVVDKLSLFKESSGWSWEKLADEINRVQGGTKGITGPTLHRYANGSSRPRNEMLKCYVLDAIELLENPNEFDAPNFSADQERLRAVHSFEQREAYFQNLYLNSPIMMHSIGRDGRLISVNNHWLQVMGYELHDVIGRRIVDFMSEKSRKETEEIFLPRLFQDNMSRDVPLQFVSKGGNLIEILLSCNASTDSNDNLEYTLAIMIDASEENSKFSELRMLRSLIKNAPDFIITADRAGIILSINRTLPDLAEEDVVGTTVFSYMPEESQENTREALDRIFADGRPTILENEAIGLNGQTTWYETHIGPIMIDSEVVAATLISTDIGERKKTEARYRTLFEQNISGVYRTSLDGVVLDANEAFAKILGFESRAEILRAQATSFYLDPAIRRDLIKRLKRDGSVQNFEVEHLRKDGRRIWVLMNSSLIENEPDEEFVILGTVIDISEKKRADEEQEQRTDFLEALHETTLGVMRHLEIDELLETIVIRAGGLLGTPHGYIYFAEPNRTELTVQVAVGGLSKFIGQKSEIGVGLAGMVMQTGRPKVVSDYKNWGERLSYSGYDIIHSIMGVPLYTGRHIVGVIGLAHLEAGQQFNEEDLMMLTQFGELASIALENARVYEQLQDQLKERSNLVEILQDSLRESLMTIRVESDQIVDHLDEPDRVRHSAMEIKDRSARAVNAIQSALESQANGTNEN
jgi:PAS domain S-box-containing protein